MMPARYNRAAVRPLPLATRVIETGILRYCLSDDRGRWLLALRDTISYSERWEVWRWDRDTAAPVKVPPVEYEWLGDRVQMLSAQPPVWAWGISCEGVWQGSRFVNAEPEVEFGTMAARVEHWPALAQWLRWWRVPLLSLPHSAYVKQRVYEQPLETLRAWTCSSSPDGTTWDDPSSWIEVLREYFHDWFPESEVARRALDDFEFLTGTPDSWWRKYETVLAASPVLLVNLAVAGLRGIGCPAQETRAALAMLAARIARLTKGGMAELARAEQACLEDAAAQWGLDPYFLEREVFTEAAKQVGLREDHDAPTRETSADNLRVALNVGPLREWLAIRLIREFTQREGI
jgi:hypothetical protein